MPRSFSQEQYNLAVNYILELVLKEQLLNYIPPKKIQAQKKDMAALDWDYSKNGELKPSDIPKRYKETINWKCHICGYEWEESPIKRKGKECPICKKKKKTL